MAVQEWRLVVVLGLGVASTRSRAAGMVSRPSVGDHPLVAVVEVRYVVPLSDALVYGGLGLNFSINFKC